MVEASSKEKPPYFTTAKERLNPNRIALATTTFYPEWYPGAIHSDGQEKDSEKMLAQKIRGDAALEMFREAVAKGYKVFVVDGIGKNSGKKSDFWHAAEETGVTLQPELERGMSGSRRQVIELASQSPNTSYVVWLEAEKVSVPKDCLGIIQRTLGDPENIGKHIIIPKRQDLLFEKTYPDYQVAAERKSNTVFNRVLKAAGLRKDTDEDLDFWFGPRIIANDPELLQMTLN